MTEYLRPQKRYAHLFGSTPRTDIIQRIQEGADHNIARFGLLATDPETTDLPRA
jgi:pyruvate ferredoxin oxidoreductase beta subunit